MKKPSKWAMLVALYVVIAVLGIGAYLKLMAPVINAESAIEQRP